MEGEAQIAETLCEVAEELPWRKLLNHARGGVAATTTSEARMEGFNETDAANLQRVKDAMAERAVGGGYWAALTPLRLLLSRRSSTRKPGVRSCGLNPLVWTRLRPLRPMPVGRKASAIGTLQRRLLLPKSAPGSIWLMNPRPCRQFRFSQ